MDLPNFDSIQNPNNYAFYVAGGSDKFGAEKYCSWKIAFADSFLGFIGLAAGCTDYGDPSDNPGPMTCRYRCISTNGGSLTVGYNSSVANIGFGNSTQSDALDGDALTING